MEFLLYNSLTQTKSALKPIEPDHVKMYVCGPTVYDRAHIGNARPAVVFDTLYRVLKRFYKVTYVRNITDVDDKIITASLANNEAISALTERTTQMYHDDMSALNALPPDFEPRATAYIPHMIELIERLIIKGNAYVAEGHVLFHVPSYPQYGALSKRHMDDMLAGARVEVAPFKKSPYDFVLWKPSSSDQPGWQSPWGWGRPGWHIECSAMSGALLGVPFDIHGGGADLMFPHHENEIAQSCCAHETSSYALTWMHNGMVLVNGQKMSKSLGNFFTVHDKLGIIHGEVIRAVLLGSHYRQALDWTDDAVTQAKKFLDKLYQSLRDKPLSAHNDIDDKVLAALADDLNTPLAFSRIHELIAEVNMSNDAVLRKTLVNSAQVLGLGFVDSHEWFQGHVDTPLIEELIVQRQSAKANKDYAEADRIRNELHHMGIVLEDGPQGTTWKKI